jgi:hypothetical protein
MSRTLLVVLGLCWVAACGETRSADPEVPVKVGMVALDERAGSPVVVLEERTGSRSLPIWIGVSEARSIAAQMEQQPAPRPNTHDLATRLLQGLDARIERVVVTELRSGVYYALIVLEAHGRRIEVDSRPSDAIAIGLRMEAPLYARESLLAHEPVGSGGEGESGRPI